MEEIPKEASEVVTRFAPSPTGYLHIGGARTALFNWLFARGRQGRFYLRIEDTDRARSTPEAIEAILDGLTWLGLEWDGDPLFQSAQLERHAAIADRLLAEEKAYKCFATPDELKDMREKARAEGRSSGYDGRWRDRDPAEAPDGTPFVIRIKAPTAGQMVIDDLVQGRVTVPGGQLDDMVLLRSDGTPTYMLSVVVDDHDMGITHVIRGDDHLTNAFRQTVVYSALGWTAPEFAHIPLIHGPDGAKLSKRHGALGVEAYRDMGYLPAALRNYLLRLGWGHGDRETIDDAEAIKLFSLQGVGKAAARFDLKKLDALNGHYIRTADSAALLAACLPFIHEMLGAPASAANLALFAKALPLVRERARTLKELVTGSAFLFRERPLDLDEKAEKVLSPDARGWLAGLVAALRALDSWEVDALSETVRAFAEANDLKLGKLGPAIRASLTGTTVSPGIFDILALLGSAESLARIEDQLISEDEPANR